MERCDGHDVVQYRGEIMPLLCILIARSETGSSPWLDNDFVQVVVYRDIERFVGLVVDQIVDIVTERVDMLNTRSNGKLLGSAVVQGHVTDVVDVEGIIRSTV